MNYPTTKYLLVLFVLTFLCSPVAAQKKDLLFSFCSFALPPEVSGSEMDFSEMYRFTIDKNGKAKDPKRLLGKYVDEAQLLQCTEKWIFSGFESGTKAAALFHFKHAEGWQSMQVSSKGFYRVVKNRKEPDESSSTLHDPR